MVRSSIPINTFFNRISEGVYHNRFCNRPILLERGAQLDKMTTVDCALSFGLRQWNSIVQIDKNDKAYDGLVRIFYANMHDVEKEDLKFKSYMRNVHFEVNPNLISRILKVPSPFIVENTVTYPYKNLNDQHTIEDVATELYAFDVEGKQKSLPFPILISKIMMHYGVVIYPSDTYKSLMSPFGECTLKKSLGQTDAYDPYDYDTGASTSRDIVQMLK
ncbi:unnamed protein product [Ilex paraguariensis]|uniref:Uncharacterized protein n=1 Tax=Ilex paraguariensis TaxID=185542 RepID=A0ABC8SIY5_9AQUA